MASVWHRVRLFVLGAGLWAGAVPEARAPVEVVSGDVLLRRAVAELAVPDSLDPLAAFRLPPGAAACDDGATGWTDAVTEVAGGLARRRIRYRSAALSDCSGMAHQVLRGLGARCEGVERPPVVVARRARDLARWYERAGRLAHIEGTADVDANLSVGALAFYLAPGRRSGGLDRVFHVGVVVDVERDAEGRVQRYALFHGRRPGKVASITRWHTRDHAVPLGNGRERLIALGFPGGLPASLLDDAEIAVADGAVGVDAAGIGVAGDGALIEADEAAPRPWIGGDAG